MAGVAPYLQLLSLLGMQVNWGTVTLTWPGGAARSNVNVFSHGLGRTPVVALATEIVPSAAAFDAYAQVDSLNSTNLAIAGYSTSGNPPGAATQQAYWLVIG